MTPSLMVYSDWVNKDPMDWCILVGVSKEPIANGVFWLGLIKIEVYYQKTIKFLFPLVDSYNAPPTMAT